MQLGATSSKKSDLSSEKPPLETLKELLDPSGSTHKDIMKMDDKGFEHIISLFAKVFSGDNFDNFGEQKQGRGFYKIRKKQLEAVWLYMAFSLYVQHWAGEGGLHTTNGAGKLTAVRKLDEDVLPCIRESILNINRTADEHFQKHSISYYQKLLQVNGNLFAFSRNVLRSKKANIGELLPVLPLSMEPHKLDLAKQNVKSMRKEKAGGPSRTERRVNDFLSQGLQDTSTDFQPVKKEGDNYIDDNSGLELDFPLTGKVAIETDSKFHIVSGGIKHTMVHSLKSFLLREQGWTRVPIHVEENPEIKASAIASVLHHAPVAVFNQTYQQLMQLQQQIRAQIVNTQQMLDRRTPQNEKEAHLRYISELWKIDNNIMDMMRNRFLEHLLSNSSAPEMKNIHTYYEEIKKQKQLIKQGEENIRKIQIEQAELRQQKQLLEASITRINTNISECSNEINGSYQDKIDEYERKLATATENKNRFKHEKNFAQYQQAKTDMKEYEEKIKKYKGKKAEKLEEISSLRENISEAQERIENIETQMRSCDEQIQEESKKNGLASSEVVSLSQKMEIFYAGKLPTAQIHGILAHSQRSLEEARTSYGKDLGSAQAENEKNRQLEQQKREELKKERQALESQRHKKDFGHSKFKSLGRERRESNDESSKSSSSKDDDYRKRDYGDRTNYYRDASSHDERERSKSYHEPRKEASPPRRNSEVQLSSTNRDRSDRRASGFMNAYPASREHERDQSTKSASSSLKIDPNEKPSISRPRRPP